MNLIRRVMNRGIPAPTPPYATAIDAVVCATAKPHEPLSDCCAPSCHGDEHVRLQDDGLGGDLAFLRRLPGWRTPDAELGGGVE